MAPYDASRHSQNPPNSATAAPGSTVAPGAEQMDAATASLATAAAVWIQTHSAHVPPVDEFYSGWGGH